MPKRAGPNNHSRAKKLCIMLLCTSIACSLSCFARQAFRCPVTMQAEDPLDYQLRSAQRCEGFVVQARSQPPIEIMGFTRGVYLTDPPAVAALRISIPFELSTSVIITSIFDQPDTLYRMDARFGPGKPLVWPITEHLTAAALPAAELNFLARSETEPRVLVPVQVVYDDTQTSRIAIDLTDQSSTLRVRPSQDLSPLVYRILPSQQQQSASHPWQSIDTVYAWEPVDIAIPSNISGSIEIKGKDAQARWLEPLIAHFQTGPVHGQ